MDKNLPTKLLIATILLHPSLKSTNINNKTIQNLKKYYQNIQNTSAALYKKTQKIAQKNGGKITSYLEESINELYYPIKNNNSAALKISHPNPKTTNLNLITTLGLLPIMTIFNIPNAIMLEKLKKELEIFPAKNIGKNIYFLPNKNYSDKIQLLETIRSPEGVEKLWKKVKPETRKNI